jgi:Reverse transcriptase (RNA-dependent DNA polymerase)
MDDPGCWQRVPLQEVVEPIPMGTGSLAATATSARWFENQVKPRLKGKSTLARFADDVVMAFTDFQDAKRVLDVLGKRLARYELTLHPDKTRYVDFRSYRPDGKDHPDTDGTTFTFLGFCHVWGKSRKGKMGRLPASVRESRLLAGSISRLQIFRYVPASKFARPRVVPTAAITAAGQLGLLRPGLLCFVTSAHTGCANRLKTGNWRCGDSHPARLRPCRLRGKGVGQ